MAIVKKRGKSTKDLEVGDILYIFKFNMNIQHDKKFYVKRIKCKVDNDTKYYFGKRRITEFESDDVTLSNNRRFISCNSHTFNSSFIWLPEDDIELALSIYKEHIERSKAIYEKKINNINYTLSSIEKFKESLNEEE